MHPLRSIFAKFLAIQLPVFLILAGIGLNWFTQYRIEQAQQHMSARIGSFAGRIAGILADIDLNTEADNANRMVSLLMSDRGIACAELWDQDKRIEAISAPRMVGCMGAEVAQVSRIPVGFDDEGLELRIGLSLSEITQIRREGRDFGWLILAISLVLAALAGSAGFRLVISRPLSRLLEAIQNVAQTSRYTRIKAGTRDEIGTIVTAFNGMQDSLEKERERVESALREIDRLYNQTPALLFTLDTEGTLESVSAYWIAATGYKRSDVTGRPFELCLGPASRARFRKELLPALRAGNPLREVPLELITREGTSADVLISSVTRAGGKAEGFVCVLTDVTQLRLVEKELRELALTDYLTKLPNRFGMNERMEQLARMPYAARGAVAVMLIDLDNFKGINDSLGHEAGDQVLVEAARRISAVVRPGDSVIRLGGDEFAIICPQIDSVETAKSLAGAVVEAFRPGIVLGKAVGHVGTSIGIAMASEGSFCAHTLLRHADQAMYAAKLEGKNRFAVFSSTHQREEDARNHLIEALRHALDNNGCDLVFQPIVDLGTLKAMGVEALLRLPGREEPVEDLIRAAEEADLMDRLGRWVLTNAAQRFSTLPASDELSLHINLSARQLAPNLVEEVEALFASHPMLRNRLTLEVTEAAVIKRFDPVCALLEQLRLAGARIAIDDFGVGYSSLNYIARLPVDLIKLDGALVRALAHTDEDTESLRKARALAHSAMTLAEQLGVPLVAEGVESDAALEALGRVGIFRAQGYFFAPPLPLGALNGWLALFGPRAGRTAPATAERAS